MVPHDRPIAVTLAVTGVTNSCSCSSCWLHGMAAIWLPQGCHVEPHGWLHHGCHLAPLCRPLAATSGASPPGVAAEGITAAQLDCWGFFGRTSRGLRFGGWCQANLLGQMVAPLIVPHRPQLDGRNLHHSCSLRHQGGTAEDDAQQHQRVDGDGGPRQHRDGIRSLSSGWRHLWDDPPQNLFTSVERQKNKLAHTNIYMFYLWKLHSHRYVTRTRHIPAGIVPQVDSFDRASTLQTIRITLQPSLSAAPRAPDDTVGSLR